MPAQDLEPRLDRWSGNDVARAPDRLDRRRYLLQRAGKVVGGRERAAAEAGTLDVLALQVDRQCVDVGRIGEHQHRQVLVEYGRNLRGAHAGPPLGERLPAGGAAPAPRPATPISVRAHTRSPSTAADRPATWPPNEKPANLSFVWLGNSWSSPVRTTSAMLAGAHGLG